MPPATYTLAPMSRICIDARLGSGISGGVEQVVVGLAVGLSKLTDGDEEYLFLTHPDEDGWLRPHLSGPSRLLHTRLEFPGQGGLGRSLRRGIRNRRPLSAKRELLSSDGTIERAGVDVIHFPMQEAFLTDVPSIYQPHDLQHLHLPGLFSERERARRELVYRTHCERATLVTMMTSWGREDLIRQYGLPPEKVAVVTWGSVISEYPAPIEADVERLRASHGLPESFLIYPAQTWPHKNHARLFAALAMLRDRNEIVIPLVCPGRRNEYFPQVMDQVHAMALEEQTWFPGFVSSAELRGVYSLARALIFPSKFEGWGMPVTEAFALGVPVASSSATGLPAVVGDAGLIFDPDSREEIGACALRLWTDDDLRAELVKRGTARAELFSIDHSARLFRAHYRRIGGRQPTEEDLILLRSSPLA
jgi:glycosyltransferase involved in cell wall biosynthesis